MSWQKILGTTSDVDDKVCDAFMDTLYAVYPQNHLKDLDKATKTQKLSNYKIGINKIGLTDLGATDAGKTRKC